jgi:hypothetical protein
MVNLHYLNLAILLVPNARSPEPVYRVAEKEWKAFLESFTDLLIDVDPQIPYLPPKDVIHRIYRDVKIVLCSKKRHQFID